MLWSICVTLQFNSMDVLIFLCVETLILIIYWLYAYPTTMDYLFKVTDGICDRENLLRWLLMWEKIENSYDVIASWKVTNDFHSYCLMNFCDLIHVLYMNILIVSLLVFCFICLLEFAVYCDFFILYIGQFESLQNSKEMNWISIKIFLFRFVVQYIEILEAPKNMHWN